METNKMDAEYLEYLECLEYELSVRDGRKRNDNSKVSPERIKQDTPFYEYMAKLPRGSKPPRGRCSGIYFVNDGWSLVLTKNPKWPLVGESKSYPSPPEPRKFGAKPIIAKQDIQDLK